MRNPKILAFCISIALSLAWSATAEGTPDRRVRTAPPIPYDEQAIEPIIAPFPMPRLQRPEIPERQLRLEVPKGKRANALSTKSIQQSIDKLASQGGGTLVLEAGVWFSGRIQLRSNIRLHLEEGVELHFSGEIKDYLPAVHTRNEGVELYSLGAMIYAEGESNIALTGKGRLIAPDYDCELCRRMDGGISPEIEKIPLSQRIFDGSDGGSIFLPAFFAPINCKNILVEDVSFEKAIFWNIAPVFCENTIIRGVQVSSFGHGRTDGIDIDSSVNTLVEYTTLDCGDDCFTLKAGRGDDGVDRGAQTQGVVIRHCKVIRGAGGIAIGSETAAGIRDVYAYDVEMENPSFPFYFKSRRPRGGGGENIWFEDIRIRSCRNSVIHFDMLGSPKWVGELAERLPARPVGKLTPKFANIYFKDITIDSCPMLIRAIGLPEQPIEGIHLQGIKSPNMKMSLQDVGTLTIE